MIRAKRLFGLARNAQGSVVVEFAILAPILFAMVLGVLTMGLHTFSRNALYSVAADTARYTVVEYQKSNKLTNEQIESKAVALSVNRPYGLDIDRLDAVLSRPATDITGTIRFKLDLTYTPYNPLQFAGIGSPTIRSTRYFYVSST
jgi:TadE-like protein